MSNSSRYHVNPATGDFKRCSAKKSCPFSGSIHTSSLKEAQELSERINSILYPSFKVSGNREQEDQQDSEKVFEHSSAILDNLFEGNREVYDSESLDALRTARAKAAADLRDRMGWSSEDFLSTIKEPDGGGTWNPYTGDVPVTGFCFSVYPERSKVFASPDQVSYESLVEFFEGNEDLLKQDKHYAGIWHDPNDGKIYLDVSVVDDDASTAREQCKLNDQIAFFDLQDYHSVTVDPNATSGQG